MDVSWAIDFFTVTTFNFTTLYVFLVLDHGRREVLHWAVTRHPYMNWVIQQLRESMPFGQQPKYLFRDNDDIYGNGVRSFLNSCGIEEVRTAYRSPWQNPFVESVSRQLQKFSPFDVQNHSTFSPLISVSAYLGDFPYLH